jgi:hypothetical protein
LLATTIDAALWLLDDVRADATGLPKLFEDGVGVQDWGQVQKGARTIVFIEEII